MNNFTTITVPTVLTASQAHITTSRQRQQDGFQAQDLALLHPRQRAMMRRLFGVEDTIANKQAVDPRPLRSQQEPTIKISLRRRITDTLNSPFEYEMSEAARVVL